ncbi:unnamed protein product [Cunninghamella echinulata]
MIFKIIYIIIIIMKNVTGMNWWNQSTTCLTNEITQYVTDHGLNILKELQLKEKDCFKKSILELENGCEQVLNDEQIQTQYALSLTLCELSMAQLPIPMDCYWKNSITSLYSCINKLSMIPQTWTTYSGYFRNVISICFALRYPIEKKLLQHIKENLTFHQVKNYEILLQQQDDFILWKDNEQSMLNSIQQQQTDLWNELNLLQDNFYEEMYDLLSIIRESKQKSIDSYLHHQLIMNISQSSFDQLLYKLYNSLQLVDKNIGLINTKMIMSSTLQNKTIFWWKNWQDEQNKTAQQWQETIKTTNQSLFHLFNHTEKKLAELHDDIDSIQTSMFSILQPFRFLLNYILNLFYIGVRPLIVVIFLLSCWLFPFSFFFTLIKIVVIGYHTKYSSLSVIYCAIIMAIIIVKYIQQFQDYPFKYPFEWKSKKLNRKHKENLELYYNLIHDE